MTDEWVVRVVLATEAEFSEAELDKMSDLADERDATVALWERGPGVVVTLTVDDSNTEDLALSQAINWTLSVVCNAGGRDDADLVDVRMVRMQIYEAEAVYPDIPELASAADAAEILGISRQRVHQLASSNAVFPSPVTRVATGPLWTRSAIEWFDSVWKRKAGRPARPKSADEPKPPTAPASGLYMTRSANTGRRFAAVAKSSRMPPADRSVAQESGKSEETKKLGAAARYGPSGKR